ncbi:unnamed protein product [Closterium sp. Naga37s-1]|nr:unnamed protein product [Closterium sp. Naga37s-1]
MRKTLLAPINGAFTSLPPVTPCAFTSLLRQRHAPRACQRHAPRLPRSRPEAGTANVLAFHATGRLAGACVLCFLQLLIIWGVLLTYASHQQHFLLWFVEEMEMEKVEGEGIVLGKPVLGAQGSVRVVLPDLYTDAHMVVHGVDRIMVPDILLDLQ